MKVRVPDALIRTGAGPLFSAVAHTWRVGVSHEVHWRALADARRPFVFVLWHEALLPLLWQHRGQQVAIVVSEGREGRYLAEYAARIGYRLLPGSSTRGGAKALLGAIHALEEGITVAFTPDGPTGPRREIKPGVVAAAQRSGTPILPVHAVAHPAWRLRSWDRMVIPRPFARVRVGYGPPFEVQGGPEGLAAGVKASADALNSLEAELEA